MAPTDDELIVLDPTDVNANATQQFHLEEVPPTVEADDPLEQGLVYRSILRTPGSHLTPSARQHWARMPVERVLLSSLEKAYRHHLADHAMSFLHKRTDVVIDAQYIEDPMSPDLLWLIDGHFFDYILVVAKAFGLHAFIPRHIPPPSFQVIIHPQARREFRARYGRLGFNAEASMLYVGSGPGGEFWLGMCPLQESEGDGTKCPKLGEGKQVSSCLKARHARMLEMFVVYTLSRLNDLNVTLDQNDRYGPADADDGFEWSIKSISNISRLYPLHLNYHQLLRLHAMFKRDWHDWVEHAPLSWASDGWLLRHVPVSISYRYGQNQRIFESPDTLDDEATNWRNEYDYRNLKFMSVALATHITCYHVDEWEERTVEEILDVADTFYTHPDPALREEVADIEAYPLRDPVTGKENRIYLDNGRYVPRFAAILDRTKTDPCGILVNLETIPPLFGERNPHSTKPGVSVYPQAFTRVFGHVQANSVLRPFGPIVNTLNSAIGRPVDEAEGENGDGMDVDNAETMDVVEPDSSQLYNNMAHRTRHSSRYHDVQRGIITSALAGTYSLDSKSRAKHRERVRECTSSLPHQTFATQISSDVVDGIPRALRAENVWIISLDNLKDDRRDGDTIFREIIYYLVTSWSHPMVLDPLRKHLVVLSPKAFPSVYNWMTFPVTALLERIWEAYSSSPSTHRPPPEIVELTAVLERTLAYAHTGNARVLSTRLMTPLWILTSLLEQGLPVLAPDNVRFHPDGDYPLSFPLSMWPLLPGYQPASASRRVQELTYGNLHFQTFNAHLRIAIVDTSPPAILTDIRDSELRRSAIIAYIGLTTYIQDIQKLVSTGVSAEVGKLRSSTERGSKVNAQHMESSLKDWLKADAPLSYNGGFELLIHAIVPNKRDHRHGLPTSKQAGLGIYAFSESILKMCRPQNPRPIAAPLISSGSAHSVLSVAVQLMQELSAIQTTFSEADFVIKSLSLAADYLHINFVPWTPIVPASTGAPARKPVYNSWMTLGLPETTAVTPSTAPAPSTIARRDATQNDCRAAWSITAISLQQLPLYLNRTIPPEEWVLRNASVKEDDSILSRTYEYLFSHLDLTKPLHHLALITSIFFAKSLPNIYCERDALSNLSKDLDAASYTEEIRKLPWTSKKKKGSTQPGPFIVLCTAFLINLYDNESPALQDFDTNNKWDPLWLEKHTSKGLNAMQVIRLGLGRARQRITTNAKIHRPTRPGDWELLTNEEIEARYQLILSTLRRGQYGPYHAAVLIVGERKAKELATSLEQVKMDKGEEITSTPIFVADHSSSGGPKRHWSTVEDPNADQNSRRQRNT